MYYCSHVIDIKQVKSSTKIMSLYRQSEIHIKDISFKIS